MQAIKTVGTSNPVIMMDEIDKIGISFQGDPASALLEVLTRNRIRRSATIIWMYRLISPKSFSLPRRTCLTRFRSLLDRMESSGFPGTYSRKKLAIAKRHLITKLLPRNGLTPRTSGLPNPLCA